MTENHGGTPRTVGIIGLGIMGGAYARNLRKAGFPVVGYDISPDRRSGLDAVGGRSLASPSEVATQSDIILIALPSVAALRQATSGQHGLVETTKAGTVVCEMGTLPLDAKQEVRDALEARGAQVLDAPVSGTGAQADSGDLVIYASGEESAVDTARPVFDGLARETRYAGPFGTGMKLKYVANLLVTIHNLAAAEALLLAQKSGLDLQMVYDAVSAGAGTSRMFEIRGPMMVADTYEPATMTMDLYQKDLALILDHARTVHCPTPLMSASVPYYISALAEGRGGQDTAAVFAVLRGMTTPKRESSHD